MPLSQLQLAGTVLAFSYVILRGLDRLGYEGIEDADQDAYLYRWNVVGHVMGVHDDLLAGSFAEADAHFEAIRTPLMGRSDDGVKLANALVNFMQGQVPGWLPFLSKLVIALFVLAAVLLWLGGPASFWTAASLWQKVGRLCGVCAAGAVAYFAALWLLGFRLRDFNRRDVTADAPPAAEADS